MSVKQDFLKERNRLLRLPGPQRQGLQQQAQSQAPGLFKLFQQAKKPKVGRALKSVLV